MNNTFTNCTTLACLASDPEFVKAMNADLGCIITALVCCMLVVLSLFALFELGEMAHAITVNLVRFILWVSLMWVILWYFQLSLLNTETIQRYTVFAEVAVQSIFKLKKV